MKNKKKLWKLINRYITAINSPCDGLRPTQSEAHDRLDKALTQLIEAKKLPSIWKMYRSREEAWPFATHATETTRVTSASAMTSKAAWPFPDASKP